VIPIKWCAVLYAAAGALVALGAYRTPREKVVPAGILAGLSFAAMQIPLLHAHVSLVGLIGILLGPWASAPVVFLVNLACALLGHGGITIVGLNTLLNWSECAGVWALYRGLRAVLSPLVSAGIATFVVLTITAFVTAFVVAWATGRSATYFLVTLTPNWVLVAVLEALITPHAVVALERMMPEWVR